jgi:hypothetical protein
MPWPALLVARCGVAVESAGLERPSPLLVGLVGSVGVAGRETLRSNPAREAGMAIIAGACS